MFYYDSVKYRSLSLLVCGITLMLRHQSETVLRPPTTHNALCTPIITRLSDRHRRS